jgi:hypothetical protein
LLSAFKRPLAVLAIAVALGAAAFLWTKVTLMIGGAKPPATTNHPAAIIWGDRVFTDRPPLARWLRSRGASYAVWRRTHPIGSAIVEHRRIRVAAPKTTAEKNAPPPTNRTRGAPVAAGTSLAHYGLIALLLLLGVALACGAALPTPFRRRYPYLSERLSPHRGVFGVCAVALLIGLLIGVALS